MQHLEAMMEEFFQFGSVEVSIVLSKPVGHKSIQQLER